MSSVVSQRHGDCLGCKIVSGGGLIGVGAYIAYHSRKSSSGVFRFAMNMIALGAAGLGTSRLLSLPPFNKSD